MASPLENLITDGKSGKLIVRMEPEEFALIENECKTFQKVIRDLQGDMKYVSEIQTWGFGDFQGSSLTSAPTMADRFRKKSKGGDNDFHTVLEEHWLVVEDIRLLHAGIRDRFMAADVDFAARVKAAAERLEQPQRSGETK